MQLLTGKTAVVTGGAGGIGSAISRKLAHAGATVIVTYNANAGRAQALLDELPGTNHSIFKLQVTDSEEVEQLATFTADKYGKLDLLVNNAGITTPVRHDDLNELSDEWFDNIFATNVRGSFAMIRAHKELLLRSKEGMIVNISSVAALSGIGSNVAYCASKAAIDSMTRSLARALAPKIRVMSVSPGWVMGEYAGRVDPAFLLQQLNATPLARFAEPEDVANAVMALATSLTFMTGSILPIDGGRLLN